MSDVVVNSAAKSVTESFHKSDLIGTVVWCNVGFGIGVRFLNAFFLLGVAVQWRIVICCMMLVLGTLGLALGLTFSFYFCLVAIVLVGCFSSFGESVLLGHMRSFDPRCLGGWSSGTGMAGIAGTMTYLLMHDVLHISNEVVSNAQRSDDVDHTPLWRVPILMYHAL